MSLKKLSSHFPGLYTGLSPLYNSEIAPLHLRGALGTVNQLAVTLGILISQVLGLNEIIGTDKLWPLLLGKYYFRTHAHFYNLLTFANYIEYFCLKKNISFIFVPTFFTLKYLLTLKLFLAMEILLEY